MKYNEKIIDVPYSISYISFQSPPIFLAKRVILNFNSSESALKITIWTEWGSRLERKAVKIFRKK